MANNACDSLIFNMPHLIYDFIYFVIYLVSLPWLLLRKIKRKQSFCFFQRIFGYRKIKSNDNFFWIHGASVGELNAASKIIDLIHQNYPDKKIIISSFSYSGYVYAKSKFLNSEVILFPLDLSFIVRNFILKINPSCVMIIEPDLWPNFIMILKKRNIPVFLLNARKQSQNIKSKFQHHLSKKMLNHFECIYAQNESERNFFIDIGCSPNKVLATGNMKLDIVEDLSILDKTSVDLVKSYAKGDFIWVCGSLHLGEERFVAEVLSAIDNIKIGTILVPRYPRDALRMKKNLSGYNQASTIYSEIESGSSIESIIIYDQLGDLKDLYQIADFTLVGGSLLYRGQGKEGHNIMEPASFAKPVIFGSYLGTFGEFAETLIKNNGGFMIETVEELEKIVKQLLSNKDHIKEIGNCAHKTVIDQHGASQRNLSHIQTIVN